MKSTSKNCLRAIVAGLAFGAITAAAQTTHPVKEDQAQLTSDKAALHRQVRRLELAEARLKADTREGKMAAESKDSTRVYQDGQIIKGEKKDISADKEKLRTDQKK